MSRNYSRYGLMGILLARIGIEIISRGWNWWRLNERPYDDFMFWGQFWVSYDTVPIRDDRRRVFPRYYPPG